MDAPLYPPSQAYEAPILVPYEMNTTNTSIAVLLANPAIKAIILKEMPIIGAMVSNEMLKPHLNNFSPRSLVQFGALKGDALDKVDAQIHMLPKAQGGAQ